jgi:hypothetical protein
MGCKHYLPTLKIDFSKHALDVFQYQKLKVILICLLHRSNQLKELLLLYIHMDTKYSYCIDLARARNAIKYIKFGNII